MRKLLLRWLFAPAMILSFLYLNAQGNLPCNPNAPKISFTGKAPSPWSIDGKISDWETILGPGTGNPAMPFNPPSTSSFNWSNDLDQSLPAGSSASEHPLPDEDIRLTAFMHDDYNVFFYFHRLSNGNSPNSFYYFCDVNADGYMNEGEPVFHATFTNHHISSLTLSLYIPGLNRNYVKGKGNPLGNAIGSNYINEYSPVSVEGYAMPGKLEKVFSSTNIPFKEHLRQNEIFDAALTENGYGVELAIPWRYLRFWLVDERKQQWWHLEDQLESYLGNQWMSSWFNSWEDQLEHFFGNQWKNTKPLKPGAIFFYKLSMKQKGGIYSASEVVDNAGNCCGGVSRSGNVAFAKSITTTVLVPHQSFRYTVTYNNLSNAAEFFKLNAVILSNIEYYPDQQPTPKDISIQLYVNPTCNGIVYPKEAVHFNPDVVDYVYGPSVESNAGTIVPPYGKVCFIVDVTIPPNIIKSATVTIGPVLDFIPRTPDCEPQLTGRVINQVGAVNGSLSQTLAKDPKGIVDQIPVSSLSVYPNPSNGAVTIALPANEGPVDMALDDYLGRSIQKWKDYSSNRLQLTNLKTGVYLLRVVYQKTGATETKKIIIQ